MTILRHEIPADRRGILSRFVLNGGVSNFILALGLDLLKIFIWVPSLSKKLHFLMLLYRPTLHRLLNLQSFTKIILVISNNYSQSDKGKMNHEIIGQRNLLSRLETVKY